MLRIWLLLHSGQWEPMGVDGHRCNVDLLSFFQLDTFSVTPAPPPTISLHPNPHHALTTSHSCPFFSPVLSPHFTKRRFLERQRILVPDKHPS